MTDWPIVGERVSDEQPTSSLNQRCREAMHCGRPLHSPLPALPVFDQAQHLIRSDVPDCLGRAGRPNHRYRVNRRAVP